MVAFQIVFFSHLTFLHSQVQNLTVRETEMMCGREMVGEMKMVFFGKMEMLCDGEVEMVCEEVMEMECSGEMEKGCDVEEMLCDAETEVVCVVDEDDA